MKNQFSKIKTLVLITLLFVLTSYQQVSASDFITKWTFPSAATSITFNALTTGSVNYTWSCSPSGNNGTGSFSSFGSSVTLSSLNIAAGDVVTLAMTSTNLKRFYISAGVDAMRLTDVTQWGSAAWSSMDFVFYNCGNLNITATDLPNLSGVTSARLMFNGCSLLNGPSNINSWNTSTITNMNQMFYNAKVFNQNIGSWNTAAVTDMSNMFYGASAFNQNIGSWNTAAVTIMSTMFYNATVFNQNIGSWNTTAVTNMNSMFGFAKAFNQDIGSWNTAAVTDMGGMFRDATVFNQNIGGWNTAAVTNMATMFYGTNDFNQNIGNWNTSAVKNMSFMFSNTTAFNQNISGWNTVAVTNMSDMFSSTKAFNQNIGSWNTAAVTNMNSMFYNALVFNQNIGGWNTAAVTDMSNMFGSAKIFNQNIGSWNTAAVTNMSSMFYGAFAFNQNIGGWNTAAVTNMSSMFRIAFAFNQNIGSWNTAAVTNMSDMFNFATTFNQNLGNWVLNPAVNLTNLISNTGMDCINYSSTLIGWATNNPTITSKSLGANGRQYGTNAVAARNILTTTQGWTIAGDAASGADCKPLCSFTPTITASGPLAVCNAGGSLTLTSSNNYNNQWYLNGIELTGDTNQTYLATAGGSYTVAVSLSYCKSVSLAKVVTFGTPSSTTINQSVCSAVGYMFNGNLLTTSGTYYDTLVNSNGCDSFLVLNFLAVSSPAAACIPVTINTGNYGTGITNVQFNTINNSHNDFNNDGLQDFSCTKITSVNLGSTYAFTVNGYNHGNPEFARIYIDYDDNGAFNNTNELVYNQMTTQQLVHTGNITIPTSGVVTNKALRMRVITDYNVFSTGCGNLDYGEAEDYGVIITCNTPATPTISAGSSTTFCTGGSVTLTSSSATENQWFESGNPISGATNQTYTATTAGTYTVVVGTGSCVSAASAATFVTLNSPSLSITNINICSSALPFTELGHNMIATGSDTLILTNAGGCDSLAIVNLTVTNSTKVFVNKNVAGGLNDGSSWANAYINLQSALSSSICMDTIWVAQGVYYPTSDTSGNITPTDATTKTFHFNFNKIIFGGFVGTETSLNQRNYKSNQTILSGDIGVANDMSDNCNHVLFALNDTFELDGFTISNGNAHATDYFNQLGGGLYLDQSGCQLRHVVFSNNSSNQEGGAMYVNTSLMTIENSFFYQNKTTYSGGAIKATGWGGISTITNCVFVSDSSKVLGAHGGGAIENEQTMTIQNCTFNKNYDANGFPANAVYNYDGTLTMFNCIIYGSTSVGNDFSSGGHGTPTNILSYNLIKSNGGSNPLFVNEGNPIGADNIWGTKDDGLMLNASSPAIDASNPSTITPVQDVLGANRMGIFDMGAYERTITSSFQSITICTSALPYVGFGHTINAAGDDTLFLTNAAGSDSFAIIHLIVNVNGAYYIDADSDSYGNAATSLLACIQPIGYVSNNTDCDDAEASIHSPIKYYIDNDNDGYGSKISGLFCSITAPTGYSVNNLDCNDAKALATLAPIADAGIDRIICKGDTITIGSNDILGTNYYWYTTTRLIGNRISNPKIFPTTNFKYIVLAIGPGGCRKFDTMNVIVKNLPTINAGIDKSSCPGLQNLLGITIPTTANTTYQWTPTLTQTSLNGKSGKAYPITTTDYVIKVTNTISGCSNRDTVRINILPTPLTDAGVDRTICGGDTITIGSAAQSSTNYYWYTTTRLIGNRISNPKIYPTSNFKYIVLGINAQGCRKFDTMNVIVNPLPLANAGIDKSIATGASIQIGTTALSGLQYAWSPTTNLSSSTIANPISSATSTTNYVVKVTNTATGCMKNDTMVLMVAPLRTRSIVANQPTNNDVVNTDTKFTIYPNPSNGIATITFAENMAISTIEIVNMQGQVINTIKLEANQSQVQLQQSNTNAGMYLVIAKNIQGEIIAKKTWVVSH